MSRLQTFALPRSRAQSLGLLRASNISRVSPSAPLIRQAQQKTKDKGKQHKTRHNKRQKTEIRKEPSGGACSVPGHRGTSWSLSRSTTHLAKVLLLSLYRVVLVLPVALLLPCNMITSRVFCLQLFI